MVHTALPSSTGDPGTPSLTSVSALHPSCPHRPCHDLSTLWLAGGWRHLGKDSSKATMKH